MNDKPKSSKKFPSGKAATASSKVLRPARTGRVSRSDAIKAVKAVNKKAVKKYWYKQYIQICPVCGDQSYIERVRHYNKKPTNPDEIYIFDSVYDHCMDYELYGMGRL